MLLRCPERADCGVVSCGEHGDEEFRGSCALNGLLASEYRPQRQIIQAFAPYVVHESRCPLLNVRRLARYMDGTTKPHVEWWKISPEVRTDVLGMVETAHRFKRVELSDTSPERNAWLCGNVDGNEPTIQEAAPIRGRAKTVSKRT